LILVAFRSAASKWDWSRSWGRYLKKCTFIEFALDFKLGILFISYEKGR
jgi:hypothetical protein